MTRLKFRYEFYPTMIADKIFCFNLSFCICQKNEEQKDGKHHKFYTIIISVGYLFLLQIAQYHNLQLFFVFFYLRLRLKDKSIFTSYEIRYTYSITIFVDFIGGFF